MKPANFPARKNQRRIEAVGRMISRSAPSPNDSGAGPNTVEKIMGHDEARAIRTKKRR